MAVTKASSGVLVGGICAITVGVGIFVSTIAIWVCISTSDSVGWIIFGSGVDDEGRTHPASRIAMINKGKSFFIRLLNA